MSNEQHVNDTPLQATCHVWYGSSDPAYAAIADSKEPTKIFKPRMHKMSTAVRSNFSELAEVTIRVSQFIS